ncbi:hypothetical protein N0V86_004487 [Didymella sp. IMI 355093]|nr:hypothetical protein N0V86_004487 [Didymella sp. IMI 355093]
MLRVPCISILLSLDLVWMLGNAQRGSGEGRRLAMAGSRADSPGAYFSTIILALAATASAQYAVSNGTSSADAAVSSAVAGASSIAVAPYPSSASGAVATAAPYPSAAGTVSVKPSGTGAVKPTGSSSAPFEGAGNQLTGSALGLIVAGGVALML